MKLILLEGSPASGKNTLGEIIVESYKAQREKVVLLDHDIYIDGLFPGWLRMSQQQKEREIIKARNKHLNEINKYLVEGFVVLAIGGYLEKRGKPLQNTYVRDLFHEFSDKNRKILFGK